MAEIASIEEILAQFRSYNIAADDKVISKCLEMCLKYNIDAEEIVDQWLAYTSSNLRGAPPTVAYLERMERKEFLKNQDQSIKKLPANKEQSPYVLSSRPSSASNPEILGTPKGHHAPISKIQTPVKARRLADEPMESTVSSPGASFGTYSKRTNARSVSCSYGPIDSLFKRDSKIDLTVKPHFENGLKADQRFMYEILRKRAKSLNDMAEDLIPAIQAKYDLLRFIDVQSETFGVKNNIITFGRVVSDSDGKINNQSVLLEQTQQYMGRTVGLNLSKMQKYSLFPGQVVAVKGHTVKSYGNRDKLVAEEIYTDTNFSLPSEPPLIQDSLQLVIAAGPFTVQDDLSFEPLNDLLQYVKEYKPDVLILLGPLFERSNVAIFNGGLAQSFDAFFLALVDNIMNALRSAGVHVVMVSSQRDPHHYSVYPTPPYAVRDKYQNLTFMPDPCMVKVNGVVVGATTADILFHISNFEIYFDKTNSGPPDRMRRMASHLLEQQSFYPLDPPNKDMCIDNGLMEKFGLMGVKPHILVLPSNLRHFVKEIDDCLVVNPERITKGHGGGTFARIEIKSGSTASVCGRSACQILKI